MGVVLKVLPAETDTLSRGGGCSPPSAPGVCGRYPPAGPLSQGGQIRPAWRARGKEGARGGQQTRVASGGGQGQRHRSPEDVDKGPGPLPSYFAKRKVRVRLLLLPRRGRGDVGGSSGESSNFNKNGLVSGLPALSKSSWRLINLHRTTVNEKGSKPLK